MLLARSNYMIYLMLFSDSLSDTRSYSPLRAYPLCVGVPRLGYGPRESSVPEASTERPSDPRDTAFVPAVPLTVSDCVKMSRKRQCEHVEGAGGVRASPESPMRSRRAWGTED